VSEFIDDGLDQATLDKLQLAASKHRIENITIPRAQHAALMEAARAINVIARASDSRGWQRDRAEEALLALKAAGIETEGTT
jgi:hypothetical protein